MKHLFENWRGYLKEVGDPDSDDDNEPTKEVVKALERALILRKLRNIDGVGANQ